MFCYGNIFEKFLSVLVKRCLDSLTLLGVLCTTKSTRSFFFWVCGQTLSHIMCGINYKFLEELRIALKCGSSAVVSEKLIAKEIKETGKQKLELIECRVTSECCLVSSHSDHVRLVSIS